MSLDSKLGDKKREEEEEINQKLLEIHQKIIDKNTSASPSLEDFSKQMEYLGIDTDHDDDDDEPLMIHDELEKLFEAEKVGSLCDLCFTDLAADPERPGALLRSLHEACVLACGHVYHYKCLDGTTLDLQNKSTDPSCIFCVSSSTCN